MTKYKYIVGNDNGNSEHDIIINGVQITQPNVLSKVRRLPMLDEVNTEYVVENIHDNLIVTINSPSTMPGIYYIGNYALKAGQRIRNIEVGVDNNKFNSDIVVNNTLGQIAAYAVKEHFSLPENKLEDKRIKVGVDMVTALPVTQYSKINAKMFSDRFMDKLHNVTVHIGTFRIDVEINFEYVKVLPEGVTATFAIQGLKYINSKEELTKEEIEHNNKVKRIFKDFAQKYDLGDIDGNYFKNKRILHVGIGEGTTEYPLTKDIVFDPNFIHGSNNGIGHAIDKSIPEFKEEYKLLSYSRQKYSEVIKDEGHKYYETAIDILEDYIEEESEEILHNSKNEIQRANNEIDIIMVYGGGSILMKEHLEQKLCSIGETAYIKVFYVPKEISVVLESMGMFEFVKGNIFKGLKAKHLKKKREEQQLQEEQQ